MRRYGRHRDKPDARDYKFNASLPGTAPLEPVDLSGSCPTTRDQGQLGSCTAFATTQMVHFVRTKEALPEWRPSPLFAYYATRKIEGTVRQDAGAEVRDALKSTVDFGVVPEHEWKYKVARFTDKPPTRVFHNARMNQTIQYHRITDGSEQEMKQCFAEGYPFIFGFMVYESFESDVTASTGIIPLPQVNTEQLLGGHCMMAVGWKMIDGQPYVICQNSWGEGWGNVGFCYLPMAYMTDATLTNDLWTIRLTE